MSNPATRLGQMTLDNMTMGDVVIADNIFREYERGYSVKDLAVKYNMAVEKINHLLEKYGVVRNEEEAV